MPVERSVICPRSGTKGALTSHSAACGRSMTLAGPCGPAVRQELRLTPSPLDPGWVGSASCGVWPRWAGRGFGAAGEGRLDVIVCDIEFGLGARPVRTRGIGVWGAKRRREMRDGRELDRES